MSAEEYNPFDMPAYGYSQAAQYVGISAQTLRRWMGDDGLIVPSGSSGVSFNNLAEAHVLKAMRRKHGVSLQAIRRALAELSEMRKTAHPLLDEGFETDGVTLCVRDQDAVVNLSKRGQREFREFVSVYLRRIQRDDAGKVTSLYPFVVCDRETEPKSIRISPTIAFGKPVLAGTGISTAVIAGRFHARDSVADLAVEYGVAPAILEDAIRWEMSKGRAA